MIQIIKRQEGKRSEIMTLEGERAQISYNSDGHLVVRLINGDYQDTLVVFDIRSSRKIFDFIGKLCNRNELPF